MAIELGGRRCELRVGEAVLASSDERLALASAGPYRQAFVLIPAARLGHVPAGALGRVIGGASAVDRLLVDNVRALAAAAPHLEDAGGSRTPAHARPVRRTRAKQRAARAEHPVRGSERAARVSARG